MSEATNAEAVSLAANSAPTGSSADAAPATATPDPAPALSKRQQRRLRKQQLWESRRDERRLARREEKARRREDRQRMRDEGLALPPRKRPRPVDQQPSNIRVAIDCDFEGLMRSGEVTSTAGQLARCYSANRKAAVPVRLSACGFKGEVAKALSERCPEYVKWQMEFSPEPLLSQFTRDDIVYLTADSDSVAEDLDPSKVYVIGGIVDKNRHKGLCLRRAQEAGLATARLPIGEYIKMSVRQVLTINHVFDILLQRLAGADWRSAFLAVIPARKGAAAIQGAGADGSDNAEQQRDGDGGSDGDGDGDDDAEEDVGESEGEDEGEGEVEGLGLSTVSETTKTAAADITTQGAPNETSTVT